MPNFLEKRLKQEAASRGFEGRKADAYVYGTMNNLGAMRGNKETPKGRAMEKKHARKVGKLTRRPTRA